jgi:N-acetylmuramoyl-L-alanine amidase
VDLIRRDAWGARPPKSKPVSIPTPVAHLVLHHTVTPDNGMQTVRDIQRFHQDARGWQDIAYTWLYSPKDRVMFEGRGPGIAGAHTQNHNRTAHAVAVLGNYETTSVPASVIADLAEWAQWHGTVYGPQYYVGHRDLGKTACPGKYLYARLFEINAAAATLGQPTEPDSDPVREWITDRVVPDYESYDAWEDEVRRARWLDD